MSLAEATDALRTATKALADVAASAQKASEGAEGRAKAVVDRVLGAADDVASSSGPPQRGEQAVGRLAREAERAEELNAQVTEENQDALAALREATVRLAEAAQRAQDETDDAPAGAVRSLEVATAGARRAALEAEAASEGAVRAGTAVAAELENASADLMAATRGRDQATPPSAAGVNALREASGSLQRAAEQTADAHQAEAGQTAKATSEMAAAHEGLAAATERARSLAGQTDENASEAAASVGSHARAALTTATAAAVAAAPGGWTWGTVIRYLLIILVLAFLGFNLFAQLGKATESVTDVFKPFVSKVGAVVRSTVDTSAAGTKGAVDVTAGAVDKAVDLVTGESGGGAGGGSASGSEEDATPQPEHRLPSPDTAGSRTQSNQPPKSGYCYIGEDRGFRSCIKVNNTTKCMSGQVYATRAQCIDPELRQ